MTYATIARKVETLAPEALVSLLTSEQAVTVYPGPRKASRYGWVTSAYTTVLGSTEPAVIVTYEYTDRNGYTVEATTLLSTYGTRQAIFDLYQIGRQVTL